MDVFAFFRVSSGKVFAECAADHKKDTFVKIFENQIEPLPKDKIIHYVMDNLASHSCYEICQLVAKYSNIECPTEKELNRATDRRQWLQLENKRIIFHYTPYHGSWLNMVEIWFGILNQKCLKESYNSPDALRDNIMSFVEKWDTLLFHPFKWKYTGEGLHLKTINRFISMLKNGIEKMAIQFMTKQFLLMTNIKKNYCEKVEAKTFAILLELITQKNKQLTDIIDNEKGPKRKEKAKLALKGLLFTLQEANDKDLKKIA